MRNQRPVKTAELARYLLKSAEGVFGRQIKPPQTFASSAGGGLGAPATPKQGPSGLKDKLQQQPQFRPQPQFKPPAGGIFDAITKQRPQPVPAPMPERGPGGQGPGVPFTPEKPAPPTPGMVPPHLAPKPQPAPGQGGGGGTPTPQQQPLPGMLPQGGQKQQSQPTPPGASGAAQVGQTAAKTVGETLPYDDQIARAQAIIDSGRGNVDAAHRQIRRLQKEQQKLLARGYDPNKAPKTQKQQQIQQSADSAKRIDGRKPYGPVGKAPKRTPRRTQGVMGDYDHHADGTKTRASRPGDDDLRWLLENSE